LSQVIHVGFQIRGHAVNGIDGLDGATNDARPFGGLTPDAVDVFRGVLRVARHFQDRNVHLVHGRGRHVGALLLLHRVPGDLLHLCVQFSGRPTRDSTPGRRGDRPHRAALATGAVSALACPIRVFQGLLGAPGALGGLPFLLADFVNGLLQVGDHSLYGALERAEFTVKRAGDHALEIALAHLPGKGLNA